MKIFAQKKEELVKLKDKLAKAKIVVFSSFAREGEKGLNVGEMRELKRGLKAFDSEYLVEKKTLLDKALTQSPIANRQSPINVFEYTGSVGVAFGYGDEQSTAKSIYNFAKKHPALKYFGAIQTGKFMDLNQFTEFAKLPTKEVMIARLLGMMKYPISALAMVLDQIAKNKNNIK
ncbi:MAG: 50S ribosomal protein L10 [Candidatus Yanofskybacteria bacterium]|nr:50S ribosomal protein L10 [Candidatus Yanofskybacteria bacterium]